LSPPKVFSAGLKRSESGENEKKLQPKLKSRTKIDNCIARKDTEESEIFFRKEKK